MTVPKGPCDGFCSGQWVDPGCSWHGTSAKSAELRRAEEDLVKADAAGMVLVEQLRAAMAEVEAWQANANTHLAECLRLEKLVIERTAERDRSRQWLDRWGKEADQLRAELASARQELELLRTDHTPLEAPGMSALTDEEFAALNPEEATDG